MPHEGINESAKWHDLHRGGFAGCKVLVTGGAGFIGSHLVEALLALSAHAVVLDDMTTACPADVEAIKGAEIHEGSILDRDLLLRCMDGCRYVFHLAALVSPSASREQPWLYHAVNDWGTFNVLDAARRKKPIRLIYAASCSAYGDAATPWLESQACKPLTPYAASKAAGESLLRAFYASYGLDSAALRFFHVFGPRQPEACDYAAEVPAFARALARGDAPVLWGDGSYARDFIYVGDAVHATLLAARAPCPLGGEALNVAEGVGVEARALAEAMAEAAGRRAVRPVCDTDHAIPTRHCQASTARCAELIQFQPVIGFKAGLKATLDWHLGRGRD